LQRTAIALLCSLALPAASIAQSPPARQGMSTEASSSYADIADLAVDSATIIDARIRRTSVAPPALSVGIPAHLVRLYVEAEPNAVIYGRSAVAQRIGYLVDVPRLANGRAPRLNRQRVLLFARPIAQADRIQLVSPSAQITWSAARETIARSIAAELATGTPPAITSVAQAFHVPGTVAGEGETQVFLRTPGGDPVSLSILRRPGAQPVWAVAFGEIVDESATVPGPRTLGWYRLACGLPPRLPAASLAGLRSSDARIAEADYAYVLASLGPCDRSPASIAGDSRPASR